MQIKEFLESVCEQIKYKPIRKDIAEELENHLEESKENYMQEGLGDKEAEEKAISQMGDSKEIGRELNKIHRPKLDWKLLLIIFVLLCFGAIIASIRSSNLDAELFGIEGVSIRKFIEFVAIGTAISVAIYFMDYSKISKYSRLLYLLATILILFTLVVGVPINGVPHLPLKYSSISPSVIAMPLYIIAFAGFLNNINKKSKIQMKLLPNTKCNMNLIKIIILSIISLMMLTAIPSITSAFILGLTYLILATIKIVMLKENRTKRIFKLWGIPIILGIMLLFYLTGSAPFKINRIVSSFNPESDPTGAGWLGVNRRKIIDSAKNYGEAENLSDAINLIDEGTNFAFTSILAHYGWYVSIAMVATILIFCVKLIIDAIKIKDSYGKLLVIGISSMFIMQSIFNILMNLNLWIEADFNLPFVSYGGGSLIINMMSLALILSIYRKKDIIKSKLDEHNKEEIKNYI